MQIFLASIEAGLYFIATIGILSSVISTFYYIRIIKTVSFEKVSMWNFYPPITQLKSIVLGVSFFLIIFLFVSPNLFGLWAYKMTAALI